MTFHSERAEWGDTEGHRIREKYGLPATEANEFGVIRDAERLPIVCDRVGHGEVKESKIRR